VTRQDERRWDREDSPVQGELALLDPLPVFELGLLTSLESGGTPLGNAEALGGWLARTPRGILVLTVQDEHAWDLLAHAAGREGINVIAALDPFTELAAAQALRAGAANVVARHAHPAVFRRVLAETLADVITLPRSILRTATATPRLNRDRAVISETELAWLRTLASGSSVYSLAQSATYSERMMYRKLRELYARLGVAGRTQALMLARDEGWL
jgi:DNA-binding NarL/FixJ family response regulator